MKNNFVFQTHLLLWLIMGFGFLHPPNYATAQERDCMQGYDDERDPRSADCICIKPVATLTTPDSISIRSIYTIGDADKDGLDDWIVWYKRKSGAFLLKLFKGRPKGYPTNFSEGIDICDTASNLVLYLSSYGDFDKDGFLDFYVGVDVYGDTSFGTKRFVKLTYRVVYWGPDYSNKDSVRLSNGYDAWLGSSEHSGRTDFDNDGTDDVLMWGGWEKVFKGPDSMVTVPYYMFYKGEAGKRWGRDKPRTWDNEGWVSANDHTQIIQVIDQDQDGNQDFVFEHTQREYCGIMYGRKGMLPDSKETQTLYYSATGFYSCFVKDVTGDKVPDFITTSPKIYAGSKGERLYEIFGSGNDTAKQGDKHWYNRPWAVIWEATKINPNWNAGPGYPICDINEDGIADFWGGGDGYTLVYTSGAGLDSLADAARNMGPGLYPGRYNLGQINGQKPLPAQVFAFVHGQKIEFIESDKNISPGNKKRRLPHETIKSVAELDRPTKTDKTIKLNLSFNKNNQTNKK